MGQSDPGDDPEDDGVHRTPFWAFPLNRVWGPAQSVPFLVLRWLGQIVPSASLGQIISIQGDIAGPTQVRIVHVHAGCGLHLHTFLLRKIHIDSVVV